MAFLKRLFRREEKEPLQPMHGQGRMQTEAEQDATRKRMEAEMDSQRERRAEGKPREPNNEPPADNPE